MMLMLCWLVVFTATWAVLSLIVLHAYFRLNHQLRMVDGLYSLMTNHTAIVSISKIDETSLSVSIVADWTGYAEQCFFSDTLEGAIAMAIEHKGKAEKRKAA